MEQYQVGGFDIKLLQNKMLGILLEIDRICRENNIRYLLDGGSMLGAVRHHGFIPWDDDADVMMPRDDYDRFIEIAPRALGKKYVFQCIENTREYPYNFGKVFDTSTEFYEKFTAKLNISHGVYVDVFPMDYVDENYLKQARMIGHLTMARYYKLGISHRAKGLVAKLIPLSVINKIISKKMRYCDNSSPKVCKLCHHGKNKPPIDISLFNNVIRVEFESAMLPVPAEYNCFLSERYGDYMKLPPIEKRVPVHQITEVRL